MMRHNLPHRSTARPPRASRLRPAIRAATLLALSSTFAASSARAATHFTFYDTCHSSYTGVTCSDTVDWSVYETIDGVVTFTTSGSSDRHLSHFSEPGTSGGFILDRDSGRLWWIHDSAAGIEIDLRGGDDEVLAYASADAITIPLDIEGKAGADVLEGGAGDDHIRGDAGPDIVRGHGGADTLYGGKADDWLDGGAGDDWIYGANDDDTIEGGAGRDILDGGPGNDSIDGGSDDDILYGSADNDSLYGAGGADVLYGGDDADQLDGGSGDDVLYGEDGVDELDGGGDGAEDDICVSGGYSDIAVACESVQQPLDYAEVCITTGDNPTSSDVVAHYWRPDEDGTGNFDGTTWGCTFPGLPNQDTACCELKYVDNGSTAFASLGDASDGIFLNNGSSDDVKIQAVGVDFNGDYTYDGNFICEADFELDTCIGELPGESKYEAFMLGRDNDSNISYPLHPLDPDLSVDSAVDHLDNDEVVYHSSFRGYYWLYDNIDADSTQWTYAAGTHSGRSWQESVVITGTILTPDVLDDGPVVLFEFGGVTRGLSLVLDDDQVKVYTAGQGVGGPIGSGTVQIEASKSYAFAVNVDVDNNELTLLWNDVPEAELLRVTQDKVFIVPLMFDNWAGRNGIGVGQVANGEVAQSVGGAFSGTFPDGGISVYYQSINLR